MSTIVKRGKLVAGEEMDAASRQRVVVTFFTTTFPMDMPEQTYSIPITTLPDGLNKIVQSTLEIKSSMQSFDFLVNDDYITSTLERFMRRRGMSFESILNIEYTPALQAKEGNKLPHDDWVASVRIPIAGFSNVLLTGSYDHCVRLWDGDECVSIGAAHKEAVTEVAVHPLFPQSTGKPSAAQGGRRRKRNDVLKDFYAASCGKDGSVFGWRFDSATAQLVQLGSLRPHSDAVDSIDFSPGMGKLICTASWDNAVKVFEWQQLLDNTSGEPEKKAPLVAFTDHTRPVLACRFSQASGERVLYSAGLEGNVKVWDVEQAQLSSQLSGSHAINGLSVKPTNGGSNDLVLASCTDNRIRLFDSRQKGVVKTFTGHRQWVYASTWLWRPDDAQGANTAESKGADAIQGGDVFVSASEDSTLRVWDLRCTSGSLLLLDSVHTDGVLDVAYGGNMEIASCGKDNKTKTSTISR